MVWGRTWVARYTGEGFDDAGPAKISKESVSHLAVGGRGSLAGLAGAGLTLEYRHLEQDQGDDKLLKDLAFSGRMLGAVFRF